MSDLGVTASDVYRNVLSVIETVEPRIADATRAELADQRASLKLIASENYASLPVLMPMGTWFSDKYAEGTVGHRFYPGCQNVDEVESIAAEHARELFGAPYAYVQPHSGIDANLVAFWAILATRVEAPALTEAGVQMHIVRSREHATGTAFICVSDDAENAITVAPGANQALSPADLPPLKGFSHLLMQLETPLETVTAYAAQARAAGTEIARSSSRILWA